MRSFFITILVFIGMASCKPKPVTLKDSSVSLPPDPYRGTCLVDGIVQNFDSVIVNSSNNNTYFYIYFYLHQSIAISLTCYNNDPGNWPSYQHFPKGVGTYSFMAFSSSGTYNGTFMDFSASTAFNNLQNGVVTITQNDSINKRISGSFNNITGFSSGKNHGFNNGEFKNAKAFYN